MESHDKIHVQDSISVGIEKEVLRLEEINDPKYYDAFMKIDEYIEKISGKRHIYKYMNAYDQRNRGKYTFYNWYLGLWGLKGNLVPSRIYSRYLAYISIFTLFALVLYKFSIGLALILFILGFLFAKSFLTAPKKTVSSIRSTVLLHYPQCAVIFAARDVRELISIMQDIDVIGNEISALKARFLQTPSSEMPTLEDAMVEYLNKHPLQSMGLIKDMILTFDTIDPDLRKQQKMDVMRLFPYELNEFFNRVTSDYKHIQSFSLMFSEMVVFSSFMMLAIFGMIASPVTLMLPGMVVLITETMFKGMIMNNMSMGLFYNKEQAEDERKARRNAFPIAMFIGFIASALFGFYCEGTTNLIACVLLGTPSLGYLFASVIASTKIERESVSVHIHTIIQEYISMVAAIKKEAHDKSLTMAFVDGIEKSYHGVLSNKIKPVISEMKMNRDIGEVLNKIWKNSFNQSQIIRPYLFFIEKIMYITRVKGEKTETNPNESFSIIYDISTQVLRPLSMKFEAIQQEGAGKTIYTGAINGVTTGIFILLGKIFQNILLNGFGSLGVDPNEIAQNSMGSWLNDFMTSMIGQLAFTDLMAAAVVSLAGTYMGVYAFQSNRTNAYIASICSAVLVSHFGFVAMEKMVGMMMSIM